MNENPTARPPSRHSLRPMIVAAVLLIVVLVGIAGYVEKWLWMRQVDYVGIFWTLLSVQWGMFCSAFVFAFLYLWINLRQAAKDSAAFRGAVKRGGPPFLSSADAETQAGIDLSPALFKVAVLVISAGVALFFAPLSTPNGILTSAFVMAGPSEYPIHYSGSMSDFMSFIFPSICCCKAA